jgi:hypothetical protein
MGHYRAIAVNVRADDWQQCPKRSAVNVKAAGVSAALKAQDRSHYGEARIKAQLRAKRGMLAIARDLKVGTGTVQRVKREMEVAGPFGAAVA